MDETITNAKVATPFIRLTMHPMCLGTRSFACWCFLPRSKVDGHTALAASVQVYLRASNLTNVTSPQHDNIQLANSSQMAPTTSPAVIPPRKRQKLTTTACEPCRNRKIRCDGNKPTCEACAKRSQQCVYQATTDVKHVNTYVDSLVQRVSQLEQELENARATILRLSTSPSIPVPPPPQAPLAPPPPHHNIDPRLLPHDERAAIEAGSVDAMGGGDEGNANIDPSFYGSSSDLGFSRQMYGTVLQKDAAHLLQPHQEIQPRPSNRQSYPRVRHPTLRRRTLRYCPGS